MLKFRYFQIRVPCSFDELARMAVSGGADNSTPEIGVVKQLKGQIFLRSSFTRFIAANTLSNDGVIVATNVPTVDVYAIRIFVENKKLFLCCSDPPRGSRFVSEILSKILREDNYFFESIEINHELISKHIVNFSGCKLVSAKVRDFHVYNGAVGRLEISSQDGLAEDIAPFLKGKHYKIDALAYAISHGLSHGLIYFSRNGTLRVSDALAEIAIPLFESALGEFYT
ncbi:hypothetical protein INH39_19460 [Massilia violaceinigra]|uniref:Aminomethyltransferase folate-binding domain-containing protein n=1 Tax=Massilia violaceinigra TaxID=2045208 RepID=A0ABY3ZYY5_9BURK|nr:hypothetical protein [Massilia violaceinigra]UOD27678.1 hypothetical protein INH39_19460 [Massilia violaceinigra]